MMLGELNADFPWGLLVVADEDGTDEIPPWSSHEEQVTHSNTAAVVRVMHQDEGDVHVRVFDRDDDARGGLVFAGVLELESGVLKVSDALGDAMVRFPLWKGPMTLLVYTDAAVEATQVDLVVLEGHRPGLS